MASAEFSDLNKDTSSSLFSSTHYKKRNTNATSAGNVRLRLLPRLEKHSAKYEIASDSSALSPSSSFTRAKTKSITQKKELLEAVRKVNTPNLLASRQNSDVTKLLSPIKSINVKNTLDSAIQSKAVTQSPSELNQRSEEIMHESVYLIAKKYNEIKMLADQKERELGILLDDSRSLRMETEELERIHNQDTPVARRSAKILKQIASSVNSIEEQTRLRRQYEHMLDRLTSSQSQLDTQMEGAVQRVTICEQELEQVKEMHRQLESAKFRAIQELQQMQHEIQVERKVRKRELVDYEIRAQNAQRMEQWRLERMKERAQLSAQLRRVHLDSNAESLEEEHGMRDKHSAEEEKEIIKVVLKQLKTAMGVDTLDDVLVKFSAQLDLHASLTEEIQLMERKLHSVRQERDSAAQSVEDMKGAGSNSVPFNREAHEKLETQLHQAKSSLRILKSSYLRTSQVILAIRQGAGNLMQRLQRFDREIPQPRRMSKMMASQPMLGSVESIAALESQLMKILEAVEKEKDFDIKGALITSKIGSSAQAKSPKLEPYFGAGNDALPLGNVRVQAASTSHLARQTDNRSASNVNAVPVEPTDTNESSDAFIPSREMLKLSSARHLSEIHRKKAHLARQMQLESEEGFAKLKAKKQSQQNAIVRLTTSSKSPTTQ